jgi:hypothetical protein
MKNSILSMALIAAAIMGGLVGGAIEHTPTNSMRADAQLVAQDRDVRYIGRRCGDDGATVISRDAPSECMEWHYLSEVRSFEAPPLR